MHVGDKIALTVKVLPEKAYDKSVIWSTDDENVATVDNNGVVTAVGIGMTYITTTSVDMPNISAKCAITVVETPAGDIIIDKDALGITGDNLEMKVGESKAIKVTVTPETTTDKAVSYSSENPSVASVDENGNVTALSLGTTTVTIIAKSNPEVKATINVTVVATSAGSIALNKTDATLKATETLDLVATILPETTTDKTVAWKSSDEAIATVDANGKVTAIAVGKATITATAASGISAECAITVVETPAGGIVIDKDALGITGDNIEMRVGDVKAIKVTVTPETTTDKSVTYESSNPAVASVDENGNVTALSLGITAITIAAKSNPTIKATIIVNVVATHAGSIILNKTEATLKATETVDLVATILPETTTDKSVTWKSSDEAIAIVDANGKVTAIAVGKAIITTTAASGISAECAITVVETPASDIIIDKDALGITGDNLEMRVGDVKAIKVTVTPETTTDKSVTYESSNPAVASVDEKGNVTALSLGNTTIKITANSGVSATINVTVVGTPAGSISLNKTEATLKATETVDLVATILPGTTTDKSVTWKSSDEAIATVDTNGKVSAVAVGKATITATAASGISAECAITVIETPAGGITIDKDALGITGDNLEMKVGESKSIKAVVTPETTTDKSVTYESSNPAVATVDENGNVTALSLGTTTVIIIAKSNPDVKATINVTVVATPAGSIILNKTEATLKATETVDLVATILPETTTDKIVVWKSSDENIASVNANGVVTGLYSGVATITATAASGVSASCTVTVLPRETAPITLTRSNEKMIIMDGELAEMSVNITGGYPEGLTFAWSNGGNTVGSANSLTVVGRSNGNKKSNEFYRVRVVDVCDGVTLLDETYQFEVETWPKPATDVAIETDSDTDNLKIREGNLLELSAENPAGGYADNWGFDWYLDGTKISSEPEMSRVMTMSEGTERATEKAVVTLTASNIGPDGTVWGEATSTPLNVTIYRRPLTPKQLLRKGDGTTCTVVAMSQYTDTDLASLSYTFVYGYTDANGEDHVVATTAKRYCRLDKAVFNNVDCEKWCYSQWIYDDGSVITSGKRYLDGRADENFDGSDFSGSANPKKSIDFSDSNNWIRSNGKNINISIETTDETRVDVYSIAGTIIDTVKIPADTFMSVDYTSDRLAPNFYIISVTTADKRVVKKVFIK